MTLTIHDRVAAARELLEGWSSEEYDALSPECKVNLQEALDYLQAFEATNRGDGVKK
jgi:hypothetical protein